jgi:hypothetical protein
MCAVKAQVLRRSNVWTEWIAFFAQVMIAISFEVGDDLGRGIFSQHGTLQGIQNARSVVSFESAHGFWFEPAWQMFFLQTRHFFALTVTWIEIAHAMNVIYVLGHVFITLGFAAWVYFYRRRYFVLLRNVIILTNVFALVIYENFPVAPPRLTSGLIFDHHLFTFQDTVFGVLSSGGRMVGTQVGYNEFSAMPSVHVAWSLVVGAAVIWLARPLAVRILGAVYPAIMLIAVVVTGNHFLMDAVGAVLVVALAASVSVVLYRLAQTYEWPRVVRLAVVGEG